MEKFIILTGAAALNKDFEKRQKGGQSWLYR